MSVHAVVRLKFWLTLESLLKLLDGTEKHVELFLTQLQLRGGKRRGENVVVCVWKRKKEWDEFSWPGSRALPYLQHSLWFVKAVEVLCPALQAACSDTIRPEYRLRTKPEEMIPIFFDQCRCTEVNRNNYNNYTDSIVWCLSGCCWMTFAKASYSKTQDHTFSFF